MFNVGTVLQKCQIIMNFHIIHFSFILRQNFRNLRSTNNNFTILQIFRHYAVMLRAKTFNIEITSGKVRWFVRTLDLLVDVLGRGVVH